MLPRFAPSSEQGQYCSKPVSVHLLQKRFRDRVSGALTDDGINTAMGTEGGVLFAVNPLLDLCRGENAETVKATAELVAHQSFFVIVAIFVRRDHGILRGTHIPY